MTNHALSAQIPLFPRGGRFEAVVNHVLEIEGGFVDHKHDKGGATKYGISLRFLQSGGVIDQNLDGYKDFDLDFDGDIDGADIRKLNLLQAQNLYFKYFWEKYNCQHLPKPIDAAVFDQAVNGGGVAAIKLLQKALNKIGGIFVRVDGQFGPETRAAINKISNDKLLITQLLIHYRIAAGARYADIAAKNPSQKVFLKGWMRRAGRLGDV